jgi:hypothetical protein
MLAEPVTRACSFDVDVAKPSSAVWTIWAVVIVISAVVASCLIAKSQLANDLVEQKEVTRRSLAIVRLAIHRKRLVAGVWVMCTVRKG